MDVLTKIPASAQAQSLLNEYRGYNYQPAIILPGGGLQGLKLPGEVLTQPGEGIYLRAIPNPARDFVDVQYRLDKEYAQAKAILTDLTGKVLYSIALWDTTGNRHLVLSKLERGVYLLALEADGKRLLTTRIIFLK